MNKYKLLTKNKKEIENNWEKEFDDKWYLWDYSKKLGTYNTCGNAVKFFICQLLNQARQQERERIIEMMEKEKRDEYGGCIECGNEMYNQAIEDIIETLNQ